MLELHEPSLIGEIGVRMALGAQLRSVLWMILRESVILLGIGLGLGLPLAIAATRGIRNQLFGLSMIDPATFATAIVAVSGMVVLATWIPARRATGSTPWSLSVSNSLSLQRDLCFARSLDSIRCGRSRFGAPILSDRLRAFISHLFKSKCLATAKKAASTQNIP